MSYLADDFELIARRQKEIQAGDEVFIGIDYPLGSDEATVAYWQIISDNLMQIM